MKKAAFLLCASLFVFSTNFHQLAAQSLEPVWAAFETGDRVKARTLLNEALKVQETKVDANFTLMLLNTFESSEINNEMFRTLLPEIPEASPYLYSFWYDEGVTNGYGIKSPDRLKFMQNLAVASNVNESIKASANYVIGFHHLLSNDHKGKLAYYKNLNSIQNWQFVGPFNNSSGSGFDKSYEPISNPSAEIEFISSKNSKIKWFTPSKTLDDPWVTPQFHINESEAIIYAQTFVNSPDLRKTILGFAGSGSIKVWLNDQLVLSQEDEYSLEVDYYKIPVTLSQGFNRILVQIGYTEEETSYPNFMVRLLDENLQPMRDIEGSSKFQNYPQIKFDSQQLPHFAESFFQQKIMDEPANLLNYLMLNKAYSRAGKMNEAIKVLIEAQKQYPNNILLNYQLMRSYNKANDRTSILKQVEHLRNLDSINVFLLFYDWGIDFEKQDYQACQKHLEHMGDLLGTTDESYLEKKLQLLFAKKEYQEGIQLIDMCYEMYPNNKTFVEYKFRLVQNQDSKEAGLKVLEKFLKTQYDYSITSTYASELLETGQRLKYEKFCIDLYSTFYVTEAYRDYLINLYYQSENYNEALKYVELGLGVSPYSGNLWRMKGYILEALGNKEGAISAFDMAIHHNPNYFSTREKRRELKGQSPLTSFLRRDDAEKLIRTRVMSNETSDDNYEYVIKDANMIIFPEGTSTELHTFGIRILNEAGVSDWKEASISYSSGRQNLYIDVAEVLKKNGQKVKAEINNNEMVFPSLEPGDAIYIEYRLDNYTSGKLRKEFWTTNTFNAFVPTIYSRLKLITPKEFEFNTVKVNMNMEPNESEFEDFKMYEWTMDNTLKCKIEDNMEQLDEIGVCVHVSTIESWKTIAEWYRDLAMPRAKEDHNLNDVYDSIFKDKGELNERQKAEAIYQYLCKNITYSSVAFRQSNHVPQKPMKTISTQLGDCKDLSTLYLTLARKAGIKTNLVLVNTRNNGENTLRVPSIEFNHCIIKISLSDTIIYQELTDEKLPFASMPNVLVNAQALIIPNSQDEPSTGELIHLPSPTTNKSKLHRESTLTVKDKGLDAKTTIIAMGEAASNYRHYFNGMTQEKTKEAIQSMMDGHFENGSKVSSHELKNIENIGESFTLLVDLSAENELKQIGGMKVLKTNLFEEIAELEAFPDIERQHPYLYWAYDNVDEYYTKTNVVLPDGSVIVELPKNHKVSTKYMDYSLDITNSGTTIVFVRKVKINDKYVPAGDYNALRETIRSIVEAEDSYVAFK